MLSAATTISSVQSRSCHFLKCKVTIVGLNTDNITASDQDFKIWATLKPCSLDKATKYTENKNFEDYAEMKWEQRVCKETASKKGTAPNLSKGSQNKINQ